VDFVACKFKQIAKLGFGRKNQLSPQLCSHLGPMAQAKLVIILLAKKRNLNVLFSKEFSFCEGK